MPKELLTGAGEVPPMVCGVAVPRVVLAGKQHEPGHGRLAILEVSVLEIDGEASTASVGLLGLFEYRAGWVAEGGLPESRLPRGDVQVALLEHPPRAVRTR